jgi:ryanodine receptor 2
MAYTPNPLDDTGVQLPQELSQLAEQLAENTHELWARQRIADGWQYGPQRNDDIRRHPCLVPYDQLPESEKEYDRLTVLGTLKAILALGYKILPTE